MNTVILWHGVTILHIHTSAQKHLNKHVYVYSVMYKCTYLFLFKRKYMFLYTEKHVVVCNIQLHYIKLRYRKCQMFLFLFNIKEVFYQWSRVHTSIISSIFASANMWRPFLLCLFLRYRSLTLHRWMFCKGLLLPHKINYISIY